MAEKKKKAVPVLDKVQSAGEAAGQAIAEQSQFRVITEVNKLLGTVIKSLQGNKKKKVGQ